MGENFCKSYIWKGFNIQNIYKELSQLNNNNKKNSSEKWAKDLNNILQRR